MSFGDFDLSDPCDVKVQGELVRVSGRRVSEVARLRPAEARKLRYLYCKHNLDPEYFWYISSEWSRRIFNIG